MRLASFAYSEFDKTEREWTLEPFVLEQVNLLVGRNATGKSRTINVIYALAQLLAGQQKHVFPSGSFDALFVNDDVPLHYRLEHADSKVVTEELKKGETRLLSRHQGDYGRILAEELHTDIRFSVSSQEVAAFAKRDSLQHSFLNPLFEWGSAVRHFEFGKTMGHANLGIPVNSDVPVNERDTTQVLPLFSKGLKTLGNGFKDAIREDMLSLGYDIEDINVARPRNLTIAVEPPIPLDFVVLAVKERDLPCVTDQVNMSQGMFRALSIIIQLNYYVLSKASACFLVDDIGEGLDFERSCRLIDVLRRKCHESSVQLIMATNDRFVMNEVPLEEWCYLIRTRNRVRVLNYQNCRDAFERFKITGLNNFDLLATNFLEEITKNGQTCDIR